MTFTITGWLEADLVIDGIELSAEIDEDGNLNIWSADDDEVDYSEEYEDHPTVFAWLEADEALRHKEADEAWDQAAADEQAWELAREIQRPDLPF